MVCWEMMHADAASAMAQVSCLYGLGMPEDYAAAALHLRVGAPAASPGTFSLRQDRDEKGWHLKVWKVETVCK